MGLQIKSNKPSPFDQHLISTPAKAHITVTKSKNGDPASAICLKDSEEVVHPGIAVPKEELCTVTIGGGGTVNLGEFNSAKIYVSLSMPTTKADLEDTFQFASDWVSSKIEAAIKEAKG